MMSWRGTVLPLTYWLTWLLPSLTPCLSAARTMSTCLRRRRAIALPSLVENDSDVMPLLCRFTMAKVQRDA